MTITIRLATPDDYEALCALSEELDFLHRLHQPERFQKPAGPSREREFLLGRIADPNVCFLVAEAEGQVVGQVQASIRDTAAIPTLRPRRYGYVEEIVVRAGYRGQSVGRQLMAKVEAWVTAQGITSIELGVYEFNAEAIEFYEKLGYTTQHRRMCRTLETLTPAD
jgi:ribosomal protein S18 acetylase RimI-like enzyme